MTAYARILTIGTNDNMPKVVKIPVGVGVDGAVIRAPITIHGDEILCPDCEGWGRYENDDRCERCDGDSIINIEQETSAGRCLPAAGVGRPVSSFAGRPLNSGRTPASGATAGLSCSIHNAERGTHSVLRSVPSSSASDRPAADMPPIALQGTLDRVMDVVTTLAGLAVFGGLAWFCLVLA